MLKKQIEETKNNKNEQIKLLKKKIKDQNIKLKEQNTKLVHKEGFLNCRGIIERFEINFCNRGIYIRIQRWRHISYT